MNRRSFLQSTGVGALRWMALAALPATFTTACSRDPQNTLSVRLLKNSIPAQLLSQFRASLEQRSVLDFAPAEQLQDLFNLLERQQPTAKRAETIQQQKLSLPWIGRNNKTTLDLVTLGDYWLANAIANQLIDPLNLDALSLWQQVPPQWQNLVKRNAKGAIEPNGQVWAAPYRWGSTVIVYRRDKFKELGWEPTDWKDLWREELTNRISLLDSPRETIGLTLKKLGKSYNTEQLATVDGLKAELEQLHRQAKLYSSEHYLEPLIIGDTWAAVGWSTEVLATMERYKQLSAVVPQTGTALWADVWVKPKGSSDSPLADRWIDFCWQKDKVSQLSLLTEATSPVIVGMNRAQLPPALQQNEILLPPESVLQNSEFLLPLPEASLKQYLEFWREMRMV